jgi:hypothetical protein
MKTNLLAAVFASVVLTGCAVWVVQPSTSPLYTPVTNFQARFNPAYQPGTFKAYLDGNEITPLFTPAAGVPGGTAAASWNLPYEGGYNPTTGVYVEANVFIDSVATIFFPAGSSLIHKLRVTGRCTPGICIGDHEMDFTPIHYIATPIPLQVPVGTAISMELRADRNLAAPLLVTVQPRLLGDQRGIAAHVQVDRAPPGMPANVVIPAGRALAVVSVAGLGPGGFWLRFSAPGTQVGGITGLVK